MVLKRKPEAPISRVILDLQKTKVGEWKEYLFQ
jgi:hypothetical protein